MTADLFEPAAGRYEAIGAQAAILRGLALTYLPELLQAIEAIQQAAPLRHLVTPGGYRMSVAMTNCGSRGWISDRRGYRYTVQDPETGKAWPAMPEAFLRLAQDAALRVGFENFLPDACLVNRYIPGARLSLHQDQDEGDLVAPIVSVSLGLPATFLFGGHTRTDKAVRIPLQHGDVAVWGGQDRLRYHGVLPVKDGHHPSLGAQRINMTFRKTV